MRRGFVARCLRELRRSGHGVPRSQGCLVLRDAWPVWMVGREILLLRFQLPCSLSELNLTEIMMTFVCEFFYWLGDVQISGQCPMMARSMAEARVKTREWIVGRSGGDFRARRAALRARVTAVPL